MKTRCMFVRTKYAAGVALGLLLAAPGAFAQWWNPSSPVPPGRWALAEKSFQYTRPIYQDAVMAIEAAINQGDFAKLDRMHDEFLAMELAGGKGHKMLGSFADAIVGGAFAGERPDRYAKLFAEWREKAPQSKVRPALEAAMWSEFAWKARGSGYAVDVPKESFGIFNERMARAAKILEEGAPTGRQSPLWYREAITTAGSLGEPSRVVDTIFNEGSSRFPDFLPLYFARVNFLLPQWGGDFDRVDAFIRQTVARTQAREGTVMYAWLYDYVYRNHGGADFFHETRASWPLMRHAFEDEVAMQDVDLNSYATYACMAEDKETTHRLLEALGERANLGVGMEGFSTEACIAMAESDK